MATNGAGAINLRGNRPCFNYSACSMRRRASLWPRNSTCRASRPGDALPKTSKASPFIRKAIAAICGRRRYGATVRATSATSAPTVSPKRGATAPQQSSLRKRRPFQRGPSTCTRCGLPTKKGQDSACRRFQQARQKEAKEKRGIAEEAYFGQI